MNDDLLIIVQQQLNQGIPISLNFKSELLTHQSDMQNLFMSESLRALNINVDFSGDQDKILRNATVLKCLSVHAALGFTSFNTLRSLPAQVSWITMNFRSFSVLFTYLYHSSTSRSGEDYSKPGTSLMPYVD